MRSAAKTHKRARTLRRDLSPPEAMLWARLRQRVADGPVIRRQHPIGPYIADFYCAATRLVVEIDGSAHFEAARIAHDARRDAYMTARGYIVIRITAAEVMADADGVAQGVWEMAMGLGGEVV